MALRDLFSSKRDVARELAEIETANSPIGQNAIDDEDFDEMVDCTQAYLQDKYSKEIMVAYLDAFHR